MSHKNKHSHKDVNLHDSAVVPGMSFFNRLRYALSEFINRCRHRYL